MTVPDSDDDFLDQIDEDTDGNRLRLLAWLVGTLCKDTESYTVMMEEMPDTVVPAMQKHLMRMANRLDMLDELQDQANALKAWMQGHDKVQH